MTIFDCTNTDNVERLRVQWWDAISANIRAMLPMFRKVDAERGRSGTTFQEFFQLTAHYLLYIREFLARRGCGPTAYLAHRVAVAVLGATRIALQAHERWSPAMERSTTYCFTAISRPIRWILHHLTPRAHRWWIFVIDHEIPTEFSDLPAELSSCSPECAPNRSATQSLGVKIRVQRDPFTGKVIRVSHHKNTNSNAGSPRLSCSRCSASLDNSRDPHVGGDRANKDGPTPLQNNSLPDL